MIRWLGLAVLLAPSVASATTGLEWKWPAGESRRFVIASQTQTSAVFQMRKEDNLDRRIFEWRIQLNLNCTPGEAGKRAVEVVCDIDDLAWSVLPIKSDVARTDEVLEEYDRVLSDAQLRMRFGYNGIVSDVELLNVKHRNNNDRVREIRELMRLMLMRPMAGLDLGLPKNGDDKGKRWQARSAGLMDFPSLQGTTGGMQVVNDVVETEGSVVTIESSGEGVRGPAVENGLGDIPNLWKMKFFSRTKFDLEKGMMVEREALAEGKITPGSTLASGTNVAPYTQAVKVLYIPEGETVEPFGPNEILKQP